MPPDRLYAAGYAGSSSPLYPRGFSPAPWTETCSWFYFFLPLTASLVAVVVAGVVLDASLGVVDSDLSGRHLRPGPANGQVTRKANDIQANCVSRAATSAQRRHGSYTSRHVTLSCLGLKELLYSQSAGSDDSRMSREHI